MQRTVRGSTRLWLILAAVVTAGAIVSRPPTAGATTAQADACAAQASVEPGECPGDCTADGTVTVDDVLVLVNIALGVDPVASCGTGDTDKDGRISIDEIIGAVGRALAGCPPVPWAPGPYGVGMRRLTFTKQSVTPPSEDRALDTRIWYPADPATASLAQRPAGTFNAPFAPGLSRTPLLVFSHGSCGFPQQSLYLTPLLASYGFIVAAPPHPGNTLSDGTACGTPEALDAAFENRPADIRFVIDALLGLNDTPESPFRGTIDPRRIGVLGHSFGGLTALRVSAQDARVIAGLALAPAVDPPWGRQLSDQEITSIAIPMMVQGGDLDTLTPFERTAQRAYDLLASPRYLVEIFHVGHFGFSDLCVATYDPCDDPATLTQDVAHRLVVRYAVPFLLRYVAGDNRFGTFLSPAPGVAFTVDLSREAWRVSTQR